MEASEEAREITEMTVEEAAQALTIEYALEGARIATKIPKSLRTLRPKKDKQNNDSDACVPSKPAASQINNGGKKERG